MTPYRDIYVTGGPHAPTEEVVTWHDTCCPTLTGKSTMLSNRELECLKWCAEGKSSWEIGKILASSEATVNFHFGNIRRKLSSNSRQHAVVKAIRLGLIFPELSGHDIESIPIQPSLEAARDLSENPGNGNYQP